MTITKYHFPRFALLLPFLFTASAALAADAPSTPAAARPKANYELAAQWSPVKVGKLVFDLAVTPHWLQEGDRFCARKVKSFG
ncbi:MAG TPA: hypothetical protein VLW65_17120 [Bryobacteraceae bacterium]|nr:hypothetical protein [Bryobacteraceae bacterium]